MNNNKLPIQKYFLLLTSHFSLQKGFTLIELLVVIGIMGGLTALGIASYSTFTATQALQSGTADFKNMVTTAKSRSLSQVKPSQCGAQPITGYQVTFTVPGPQYVLSVRCNNTSYALTTRELPTGVTFAAGSTSTIFFPVAKGTSSPASVTLNGDSKTKTVTVTATGAITSN